jgi:hypothetical protein
LKIPRTSFHQYVPSIVKFSPGEINEYNLLPVITKRGVVGKNVPEPQMSASCEDTNQAPNSGRERGMESCHPFNFFDREEKAIKSK